MSSSKPNHQPNIVDPTPLSKPSCLVRIHRPDDTYHVILLEWDLKVTKLIAALGQKLGLSKEEVAAHRLFIEERGTERVLLPMERPARIIQGRSQEAGYDDRDFEKLLSGKDASFMFKLTFKSYLTPNTDYIASANFENVGLTSRDLHTVPKAISDHAQKIVSLTLGNNIILATPHFLGSCTGLHKLCWSGSAIHQVPHSLCHAFTIRHLDLSSNRIEDLQDTYLGNMPLEVLLLQNNCISEIPSHFSRLGSLKTLNLSNNSLASFPDAISSLGISDLDLSFNHISSIHLTTPMLPGLQRFLVNGNGLKELSIDQTIGYLDVRHNRLASLNCARAGTLHAAHGTNALLDDLEVLSCSYNALIAFPDIRASNSKLRVLDLHHNSIIKLPEHLWDLPLTTINLTSNKITAWPNKRSESTISKLGGSLEELFLSGNLLRGDALESFQDLVKLRTLHLSFNEIASCLPKNPQARTLGDSCAYISDAQHAQGIFEVVHQFPEGTMSIFALFQLIKLFQPIKSLQPTKLSKHEAVKPRLFAVHLRDRFVDTFITHLEDKASGRTTNALRLTFLDLNHNSTRAVAPAASPPAWWIRLCQMSRAFGLLHLFPAITPRPSIREWNLTESDEFLIIANHQFWDCVTYQVAVDIVQGEIDDLRVATQKLLEMALGFRAKAGVCVMVVAISELYEAALPSPATVEIGPRKRHPRMGGTSAPTGHAAVVFVAIRGPTPSQTTIEASRTYRTLLRQELHKCGGYEGAVIEHSFFCVFQSTLAAVQWCLSVQLELTRVRWGEGDNDQQRPYVLPVSIGVHCGLVVSEPNPITQRMEYFGPTVTLAARISDGAAQGGIMCSADITRAVRAVVFGIDGAPPVPTVEPDEVAAAIRGIGVVITPAGERHLGIFETPEALSLISPVPLAG
ncbi:hypothetical protein BD779DRAFT_1680837 [Infundibulicybe gibba]|nr:hypothetical protein BD779DRAFT_1680837 [Infundibulicybe gibba]